MSQSPVLALHLSDALDQVIANPTASHCWHSLANLYGEADHDLRTQVQQHLKQRTPTEGLAGFLRATFLFSVIGDPAYIAEAAQLVQSIAPLDPSRLAAFVALEWWNAVQEARDRPSFIRALRHARLPEIIKQLGQHLSLNNPTRPVARDINRVTKIALIAPYISNTHHTPTSMAINQARLLIEQGLDVHLFACQESSVPQMAHYFGHGQTIQIQPPNADELTSQIPLKLAATLSDERFSLMRRWHDMLEMIKRFDPDVVLLVGLFSPLVAPLYTTRPIVGLSVHSVPPIAPLDVWLTAHKELDQQSSQVWGPDLPDAWGFYHPYRIALKPTGVPLTRNDLGLPEHACVFVTAGYRLKDEINGDWAAQMTALLKQHPTAVWLLVGGSGTLPPALNDIPQQQLYIVPNHPDLRSVYRCCDIYLNPPRMGGGFSVAEAMAESLPVVSYANSDGGHKVGAAAVNSADDYFALLLSLMKDADLRHRTGVALQAHFTNTLDLTQSGPSLVAACDLAVERYRQRTS